MRFQSTLSVRRATTVGNILGQLRKISIHALREESDPGDHTDRSGNAISIHALREESDCGIEPRGRSATYFNPRSP